MCSNEQILYDEEGSGTVRNLVKLLYQRVGIVSICLLLQLLVVFAGVRWFSEYAPWYNAAVGILALILTLVIVSRPGDMAYKVAWIIPILAAPIFGVTLYLMFGGDHQSRRIQKNLQLMNDTMQTYLEQDRNILDRLELENLSMASQSYYLASKADCPIYRNTRTEYFPTGEDCFAQMCEDLKNARQYIYLEYFIIERGEMWNTILEILREKASQGVDVRVIYDDFGCITKLPYNYDKQLEAMGIHSRRFNPFVPIMSPLLNNRDHRKLMIMDGTIGYTGGINLADEYINTRNLYGHWKDCGLRLEGDAVWSMTIMFQSMWNLIHGKHEQKTMLPPSCSVQTAAGYVQPFTDYPLDNEGVSETVFLNMIARAKKSVYIMTPYLILDAAMLSVLTVAAKSGVDVRIITPGTPDKQYVYLVTRANYGELLKAGVRIYEYTPGFIHSKVVCVDMESAVVGTVNMDFRSLYLHYEDGVLLYNTESVQQVSDDFADTLPLCREVTLQAYQDRSKLLQILEMCLRIFAPLM